MIDRLYTVTSDPSATIIAAMLRVLYPDARTVLDATYGNGRFWDGSAPVKVTGMDRDPSRAKDVCADFTALPFQDASFDIVVFDPPFHTDMGRGKPSVMGARFGTYPTISHLHVAVRKGCREAKRVARLGVIVKLQDYCHASQIVWMSDWAKEVLGTPYDQVIQMRRQKMVDPKWTRQLSAWRNHATYWAFRHDGPIHKGRKVNAAHL